MHIGVPKESKNHEYRVGLIPAAVMEVIQHGHQVTVQTDAGASIGYTDDDYRAVGAEIANTAEDLYAAAELIVKVKEPQANERALLQPHHTLFAYLHLAPDEAQTQDLLASGATCIAYETVTDRHGGLPLLAPMSEVAGRLSVQAGARCLEKVMGGRGVLLGGVPGVAPGNVTILGGGVVGQNALAMAVGMGANVTVLDKNIDTLRHLDAVYASRITTLYSTAASVEESLLKADLVIGAVLLPGAEAPKLVSEDMIRRMQPGSVVVDVAIDQGGCMATSRPTTHDEPTYVVDGVVHYCVANMPGAVAHTATRALNNVTLPFVLALADRGVSQALIENEHLCAGLNVCAGELTNQQVAQARHRDWVSATEVLSRR